MKTAEQNIVETLRGKSVLFIENNTDLGDGVELLKKILDDNGIENSCLFEADHMPLNIILMEIIKHDCIAFMTTWQTKVSHQIYDLFISMKEVKIIVECYINEPTWSFQDKNVIHPMYIFCCYPSNNLEFHKLSDIPYYTYENKFDK